MNLRDSARPDSFTPTVRRLMVGEFDEGPDYSTYRRRGTTDWLLIHTLGGRGRFGTAYEDVVADPESLTLVRPGTLHDYGVESELRHWHFLFAHFHPKPDWLPLLDWPEAAPGILQLHPSEHAADRIASNLAAAVRHQSSVLAQGELLALNALEAALLWADTQNPKAIRIDDRLLRAIELVDRDLKADLGVPRLARAASLSPSRFAHLFRAQLGVTPQQFVERRRLEAARRLLELTTRPISSVAAEVGFTNPLYFSTRFRHHTGATPTAYRRG
ncbi:AraC family transcriptional regulator [Kribbella sp. ALI-6-A]|uniref:helix-turn-helix domain-containing protein n=1 Tax=Kribbella sp. ALI-6-A TaxID=1933817 RepID=UPI00097C6E91|nr:helix-turn-helix domain-containing protein [Kribbella sp. ALI-6-A]ONI72352.1 AraC family transcriptional regulator [Kribbella sp. ALI-6-A]